MDDPLFINMADGTQQFTSVIEAPWELGTFSKMSEQEARTGIL